MQFSTLATLILSASAAAFATPLDLEKRTNEKANEYTSGDCSGPANYAHVGQLGSSLQSVNMDPSSHSVYLAGAKWQAYSAPDLNGNFGTCKGDFLGKLPNECNNLDTAIEGKRIACVSTY